MKRIVIPVVLAISIALTGCATCNDPSRGDEGKQSVTSQKTDHDAQPTKPETFQLTVYHPNETVDGFDEKTVEVTSIDEQVIVEQLILAGVLPVDTSVNSIESEAGQLRVDFNSKFRDAVSGVGTAGEYVNIGSVVNTFLVAYDAKEILITVDGEVLESGHNIYDSPLTFFESQ
ncbi:MAG: GerMN domain-containing protein [Acidobacteriota bacterium]|nr:GerMN domain-containing protein [Acidobacteriota bacterium]